MIWGVAEKRGGDNHLQVVASMWNMIHQWKGEPSSY